MHQKSVVLYGRRPGGVRIVELDVVFVRHSTRAQLFHDEDVVRGLVRRAVPARKWNNLRSDGTAITPTMFRNHAGVAGNTSERVAGERRDQPPDVGDAAVGGRGCGRTSTTFTSARRTRRRSWPRTSCPGPPPPASSRTRSRSTRARRRRRSGPPAPRGLPGTTYYWMVRGKTMLETRGASRAPCELYDRRAATATAAFASAATASPSEGHGFILADAYVRAGRTRRRTSAAPRSSSPSSAPTRVAARVVPEAGDRRRPAGRSHQSAPVRPVVGRACSDRDRGHQQGCRHELDRERDHVEHAARGRHRVGTRDGRRDDRRLVEVDLTTRIQAERAAGQTTVSIALRKSVDSLPCIAFGSRESSTPPALVIVRAP